MEKGFSMRNCLLRSFYACMLSCFIFSMAFANENTTRHTKVWLQSTIIGPLIPDTKFRYYLLPRVRFIDNKYKYEESSVYLGLGYQPIESLLIFAGVTLLNSKSLEGDIHKDYRYFQQTDWAMVSCECIHIINRSLFEFRKRQHEKQYASRLRERIMIRIPLSCFPNKSFVFYDEVFLNFNHPRWVSRKFVADNRIFVGMGFTLSKTMFLDLGYLKQYQYSKPNRINNVILSNLNMNFA